MKIHTWLYIIIDFFIKPILYSEKISLVMAMEDYDVKNLFRSKRYLVFPNPRDSETKVQVLFGLGLPMEGEVSTIIGYVLKCNYNLPYNSSTLTQPYVRYQRDANEKQHNQTPPLSRWEFYRLIESALETLGSGRACLLRAICETAHTPFDRSHGLLGELLHVILTPSSTLENFKAYGDREYYAAEFIGRLSGVSRCGFHFAECPSNPLDYFTL